MRQAPNILMAHGALLAVALFYGINYFLVKGVFDSGYSPYATLSLRNICGIAFFVLFHALFIREKIQNRKDYILLAVCGLFGICLNQTLFLTGLSETSKVNASVLMITTPVFVFVAAALLREERITLLKVAGLLLSLGSAIALITGSTEENLSFGGASVSGDLKIMINAASYGLYLVLVRPLVQRYNTFTIIKWIFLFGGIPNILIGWGPLIETRFSEMPWEAIVGIAWLVVCATLLAYLFNAWAMKRLPSSAPAAYIYLQPVIVSLGSLFLGEAEVTWQKALLMVLIATGVYLITKPVAKPVEKIA